MKKLIAGFVVATFALAAILPTQAQCCSSESASKQTQSKSSCCAAKTAQVSKSATKSSTSAKVSKKRNFEVKGATLLVGR